MNKKRQKFIEDLAWSILQELDFHTFPIDVSRLAKLKGLEVVPYDFEEEISGVLIYNDGKATIGYNRKNSETRQRFTIAHELGHYILGHQREGVFVDTPKQYFTMIFRDSESSTGEHTQEREANAFAAALLMPNEFVLSFIKNTETEFNFYKDDIIKKLCNKFKVSNQAMAFRLTNLELLW